MFKTHIYQFRKKHVSDFDKRRIIQLRNPDWSLRHISKEVGCGKSTVQRIVSRFLSENLISRKSGSGRKQKTTEREDCLIVREVVRNGRISVSQIKQNLNREHLCISTGISVSHTYAAIRLLQEQR